MLIARAGLRGHGTPPQFPGKTRNAAPNFDVRTSPDLKADAVARLGRGSSVRTLTHVSRSNAATARLRDLLPDAAVTLSPMTGGAQMVANPRGALTAPSIGDSRGIVGNFLQSHAAIYGLDTADVSTIRFEGESISAAACGCCAASRSSAGSRSSRATRASSSIVRDD